MTMRSGIGRVASVRRFAGRKGGILLLVIGVMVALPASGASASTVSVNCDTGGNLQNKIDAAASGDTILIKGTCVGNFLITSKGLTLKGDPTATLEGNDVFRPLGINNSATPGKSVHLTDLTITGGVTTSQGGGGILHLKGNLSLTGVTVTNNVTTSPSLPLSGGGIFTLGGNLSLTDSTVSNNRARTTAGGGEVDGGGIAVASGNLTVTHSKVIGNRASTDLGSGTARASGGGIYVQNGKLVMNGATTVSGNRLSATGPGDALAFGGGVRTELSSQTDLVTNSVISGNSATAVAPAGSSAAGNGGLSATNIHVTASMVSGNVVLASGSTAQAQGAGLGGEDVTVLRSTVSGNREQASSTSSDAGASGGGINAEQLIVKESTIARNVAFESTSGSGDAVADGGGVHAETLELTNSTIGLNKVTATSTGSAQPIASGGGITATANTTVVDSTVAGNSASASGPSASSEGGGLDVSDETTLEAAIVANNTATTGPNCVGGPTSNGHNLIRKAIGCSFIKKGTDKVGVDPKLGLLKFNGGPTQTMAIGPTSPARDAILKADCAVTKDQRGVARPQPAPNGKCDIGAYERKP